MIFFHSIIFSVNFVTIFKHWVLRKNKSTILRKLLLSFMTFAFFYLLIGDLIIVHQRAIFNYDAYADQPILKPHKTGKENFFQTNGKKINSNLDLLTFISGVINHYEIKEPRLEKHIKYQSFSVKLVISRYPSYNFRGPPHIS